MQPTADSFRALARSSPWRWRTLHFSRHDRDGSVEAWVRRPGELLVRRAGEPDRYESGVPHSSTVVWVGDDPDFVPPPQPRRRLPHQVRPALRADGLVDVRPDDVDIDYGDPMYADYTWVAMLDPVELSHGVVLDSVRAEERAGREAWRARVRPAEGYDPRCTCCPLLPNRPLALLEYADSPDLLARIDATDFPDAFEAALDVRTGVVVDVTPIGGDGSHLLLTVDLHEVDTDLDAVFAGHGR